MKRSGERFVKMYTWQLFMNIHRAELQQSYFKTLRGIITTDTTLFTYWQAMRISFHKISNHQLDN